MGYKNKQAGFTIVELLIVIIIIGILAGIVIVTFSNFQARARDAERQTDLKAVRQALELYYVQHSTYPTPEQVTCGGYGDVSRGSSKSPYDSFIKGELKVSRDAILPPDKQQLIANDPTLVNRSCGYSGFDQCNISVPRFIGGGSVSHRPTDVYTYCTLKNDGVGGWQQCYGTLPGETCDYYILLFNYEVIKPDKTIGTKTGYIESYRGAIH